MGNNVDYSHAELGQEPSPEMDWVEEWTPEALSKLDCPRMRKVTAYERQRQAWLDEISLLSQQEFEKRYF